MVYQDIELVTMVNQNHLTSLGGHHCRRVGASKISVPESVPETIDMYHREHH
jgi:hypothetical protein